jgi:hypothetical protein
MRSSWGSARRRRSRIGRVRRCSCLSFHSLMLCCLATPSSRAKLCVVGDLPCNSRVSIDPPRPPNASLSVKDTELVEAKLLLQLTCHGNARSSRSNNDHGVVCVSILVVAINSPYRFANHHLDGWL